MKNTLFYKSCVMQVSNEYRIFSAGRIDDMDIGIFCAATATITHQITTLSVQTLQKPHKTLLLINY